MDKKWLIVGGVGLSIGVGSFLLYKKNKASAQEQIPDTTDQQSEDGDEGSVVSQTINDPVVVDLKFPTSVSPGSEYWPEITLNLPYYAKTMYHVNVVGHGDDLPELVLNNQTYKSVIPVMNFYFNTPDITSAPKESIVLDPNTANYVVSGSSMVEEEAPGNISVALRNAQLKVGEIRDRVYEMAQYRYSVEFQQLSWDPDQMRFYAELEAAGKELESAEDEVSRLYALAYGSYVAKASIASYNKYTVGFSGSVGTTKVTLPAGNYPVDITITRKMNSDTEDFFYQRYETLSVR